MCKKPIWSYDDSSIQRMIRRFSTLPYQAMEIVLYNTLGRSSEP